MSDELEEHVEIGNEVSQDATEFKDINDFIEKRMYIERDMNGDPNFWLDVMMWTTNLSHIHGCVRPVSVYVAMLESKTVYDRPHDELLGYEDNTQSDCIMYMGMLLPLSLVTCQPNEKGIVNEHTVFTPVLGERWDYFCKKIADMMREQFYNKHTPIGYDVKVFMMHDLNRYKE